MWVRQITEIFSSWLLVLTLVLQNILKSIYRIRKVPFIFLILVLFFGHCPSPIVAEGISYTIYHFWDERPNQASTEVTTSSFSISKKILAHTGMFMDIELDQVTSPPLLDGATGASRPAYKKEESFIRNRGQIIAGLEQALGQNSTISGSLYISQEIDYQSFAVFASYSQDFLQKNLNLLLTTSINQDKVGYIDSKQNFFEEPKEKRDLSLSVTQVLGPTTVFSLTGSYSEPSGKLSDPYRAVKIGDQLLPEKHPDERYRYSVTSKLNQYIIPLKAATLIKYRLYIDQWESIRRKGVTSHTFSAKLNKYITENFIFSPWYRYYIQDNVYFSNSDYQYSSSDLYYTGDYKLQAFESNSFGIASTYYFRGLVGADSDWSFIQNASLRLEYFRYWNTNKFAGNILEAGLEYAF